MKKAGTTRGHICIKNIIEASYIKLADQSISESLVGVWPLGLLLLKNEVNRRDTKTLVNDLEQNKTRSFVWYVQRFWLTT